MKIAIVDDEPKCLKLINDYIAQYFDEKGKKFCVTTYTNGLDFISDYRGGVDVIFMDIVMPLCDGLEAAQRLRKLDAQVGLVFITNMAQLAIRGYEVSAVNFLIKPVSYFDFSVVMDKIYASHEHCSKNYIWVKSTGAYRRIEYADIYYMEIVTHNVHIHTPDEIIKFRGSLKNMMEQLDGAMFMQCNSCYLVNLQYVKAVDGNIIKLENGDTIHISRSRKEQFVKSFTSYFSRW